MSLQKARDHGIEPQVASHVIMKMEEVYPLCARWKTEVAAWCEEVVWKAEAARQVKEEWRAAPSMLFKPTGLHSGEVVLGKAKGKGQAHMHVGGAVQGKCQIRGPILQTKEGEASALTGSWQATMMTTMKW